MPHQRDQPVFNPDESAVLDGDIRGIVRALPKPPNPPRRGWTTESCDDAPGLAKVDQVFVDLVADVQRLIFAHDQEAARNEVMKFPSIRRGALLLVALEMDALLQPDRKSVV